MPNHDGRRILFLAVCTLGISSIVTQLTLMREMLRVFSGNELVLGIVLGNWMLLTGIGSAAGRTATRLRRPLDLLVAAQIVIAIVPIADVFLLRTLRNVVFIRGAEVGVTGTVASCFVLLAPYCLMAGYLLTLACRLLASGKRPESIGRVYFLDSIGDVLGGLLFSFVLIYWFDHFRILYFPALLNLLLACLTAAVFKRRALLAVAVAATVALVGLIAGYNLDDISARIEYAGQEIVYKGNSPYGNLIVTRSAGQYNFIENGVVLFSTDDVERVEETVHYAMAQRPDARRVLLISGGISGTAKEILKYKSIERVDYVELDPAVIRIGRKYLPERLADGRIHVVNTDGRLFIKQTDRRWDVVILDVPDPSTSQINRFNTREFFEEVKKKLTDGGVVSFSLGHYENYLGRELAALVAAAHRTAKSVFGNVLMIPGGQIYFLASDGPLTTDIAGRIQRQGIHTLLVNDNYLRAVLTPDRMDDLRRAVAEPKKGPGLICAQPPPGRSGKLNLVPFSATGPTNRDFSPILYYYNLRYWISQFRVRYGLFEGALAVLAIVCLLRFRPVSFAVFTTGFAASALEVVLLVGFQILYGCVYHKLGLIVTMFMLGLGIGSFAMNRMLPRRSRGDLVKLELAVALYAALTPLMLVGLGQLVTAVDVVASQVAVPFAAMVLAVLVGMEFPLAAKADFHGVTATAARLYTADYIGAALGALLVSTLLIPIVGVVAVCMLAAGLNVLSGIVILATGRS